MKKVTETVMTPIEHTTFVAEDGTTFQNEWSCRDYELDIATRALTARADVVWNDAAEGWSPFSSDADGYGDSNFVWFKALTKDGLEAVAQAYDCTITADVGKWVCLELHDGEVFTSLLDNDMEYVVNLCDKLGIDVTFTERAGKEANPDV